MRRFSLAQLLLSVTAITVWFAVFRYSADAAMVLTVAALMTVPFWHRRKLGARPRRVEMAMLLLWWSLLAVELVLVYIIVSPVRVPEGQP
jgi:hypothetical protein